jgi:hypothetical protein
VKPYSKSLSCQSSRVLRGHRHQPRQRRTTTPGPFFQSVTRCSCGIVFLKIYPSRHIALGIGRWPIFGPRAFVYIGCQHPMLNTTEGIFFPTRLESDGCHLLSLSVIELLVRFSRKRASIKNQTKTAPKCPSFHSLTKLYLADIRLKLLQQKCNNSHRSTKKNLSR